MVSVCMIHAGEAYNIIPGEVAITGSTRTFSKETRERLPKLMEELQNAGIDRLKQALQDQIDAWLRNT